MESNSRLGICSINASFEDACICSLIDKVGQKNSQHRTGDGLGKVLKPAFLRLRIIEPLPPTTLQHFQALVHCGPFVTPFETWLLICPQGGSLLERMVRKGLLINQKRPGRKPPRRNGQFPQNLCQRDMHSSTGSMAHFYAVCNSSFPHLLTHCYTRRAAASCQKEANAWAGQSIARA